MTWRASSHAKYDCQYHVIWCPKRRRALGDAELRAWIAEPFRAIAEECGFAIEELAVEDDHVHLSFPKTRTVRSYEASQHRTLCSHPLVVVM